MPIFKGAWFGLANYQNTAIFKTGGSPREIWLTNAEVYIINEDRWVQISSICGHIVGHSSIIVQDRIYLYDNHYQHHKFYWLNAKE